MGTVDGYTAAEMKKVEDANVVDGDVISDNLILTKYNKATIDAGHVRGPQGDVGPTGPVGASGLLGAMGLIYRLDLATVPLANRQITTAEPSGQLHTVHHLELNASNLPPGFAFSLTRRYQYMFCGTVVFDAANTGGDLRIQHTDLAELDAMMWQGISFRAGQPFPISAMSKTFKIKVPPVHIYVQMMRSTGTGAMTLDINLGACEVMLFDVGELVP